MLSGVRCCFLLSFVLAFSILTVLPVQAQINGVPASVTSLGFGGRAINGVPSSVTSLGPNGYGNSWSIYGNCCANFFMPANPGTPLIAGRHHHHRKDHEPLLGVGIMEPVYVPYAIADEGDDDDSPDADAAVSSGARHLGSPILGSPILGSPTKDSSGKRAPGGNIAGKHSEPKSAAGSQPAPMETTGDETTEPVAAQPSTVLVFKDGHKSDVTNYAIVGDTLFDFEGARTRKILLADLDLPATHKANDDRGIDFQIPAGTKGQ